MEIMKYLKFITVEPVLFLYMMAIFIESTALRSLMHTKACLQMYQSLDNCSNSNITRSDEVIQLYNSWNKYYETMMFSCTLIMSFYVASWSDYLGRKVIMMIAPIGTIVATFINVILSVYMTAHIAYFLISAVISGLTFGTLGVIASTFGYISDVASEDSRTKRIFILEVMIFSGSTLGTYICGEFLNHINLHSIFNEYTKIFGFECLLAAVVLTYIVFRIPLRIGPNNVTSYEQLSCSAIFSLVHLKKVKETVFKTRPEGRRKTILLLLLSLFFIYYGFIVQFTLTYTFVEKTLKWNITEFSRFTSVKQAIEGGTLLLGLPVAFYWLGIGDSIIATAGILSRGLGLALIGFSNSTAMMYSSTICSMLSEFPVPTVRSMLSKLVDKDERGKIFAFTTVVQNLCFFTGGFIFPTLFQLSFSYFPGLCFEIVAGLQIIAIICIFCAVYFKKETITVYETFVNENSTTEYCATADKEMIDPS